MDKNDYHYGYQLSSKDFLDIIDETCSNNGKVENLNIFFDEKSNKLRIFLDEWNEFFMDPGIEKVLLCLKDSYLDHYEQYLYCQVEDQNSSCLARKKYDELIDEYYRFLYAFELSPTYDSGYDRMKKVKEKMTIAEKKDMYKKVVTIIKTNSKKIIKDLNTEIAKLFHMDENFKSTIVSNMLT